VSDKVVENLRIYAMATDPIYIGTGGYTIGRVDNTIVRDPITNIPKIPGSSLAGTWRYYVVLEALKDIKDKQPDLNEIKDATGNTLAEKLKNYNWKNCNNDNKHKPKCWKGFWGNQVMKITCAGQDNVPQENLEDSPFANREGKTGHCGHCIVCKGFGFSKKDISWQGMLFFSDLQILFFPVFTIKGTKWITTERILELGLISNSTNENQNQRQDKKKEEPKNKIICITENDSAENAEHINLGWLYLPCKTDVFSIDLTNLKFANFQLNPEDIIIIPEDLFSQIVNSNLEVRTSVSIDPITGAAKEGALFTSEAIPRGTIFYGDIRIFNKKIFSNIEQKLEPLPTCKKLLRALCDSKHYYETLGIGGMTTRGFGRLKIEFKDKIENLCKKENNKEDNRGGGPNEQSSQ